VLEIAVVAPGSLAEALGFRAGDSILSINAKEVNDPLDYAFLVADEKVTFKVRTAKGSAKTISLDKLPDDMLGLEFAPLRIKRCRNKCIFCFVDQMPPGCRKSLSVKDDDFRASFLYGNYITLSNLTELDWHRIFEQRLSPLYVSVHSTDPELRSFIIGNKKAPPILESLERLAAGGIRMHTQIVLSPGVNDGPHLDRTLHDLSALFPAVSSVAVVPVGLTSFRKGLYPQRSFTQREAAAVVDTVVKFGATRKKRMGARFVFASDEFYIKAKRPFPSVSFYEDFPQIENGVGMVADFMRSASGVRLPERIAPLRITIATGASFGPLLKTRATQLDRIKGLTWNLIVVRNVFFGPSVTVAGLLTGADFAASLSGKRLGDLVFIPRESLKQDACLFLDGMRLERLESLLHAEVAPVLDFKEMIAILRQKGKEIRR
jgi:putative radical SAM enzyme (TIGR03279 family)